MEKLLRFGPYHRSIIEDARIKLIGLSFGLPYLSVQEKKFVSSLYFALCQRLIVRVQNIVHTIDMIG